MVSQPSGNTMQLNVNQRSRLVSDVQQFIATINQAVKRGSAQKIGHKAIRMLGELSDLAGKLSRVLQVNACRQADCGPVKQPINDAAAWMKQRAELFMRRGKVLSDHGLPQAGAILINIGKTILGGMNTEQGVASESVEKDITMEELEIARLLKLAGLKAPAASQKTLVETAKPSNLLRELDEKYMGFDKLKGELAHKPGIRNPGAVAASIGNKKYGKKKMHHAAATGHSLVTRAWRKMRPQ
jgi:hypothetical protein